MKTIKASDIYYDHVRALPIAERLRLVGLIVRELEIDLGDAEEMPRPSIMELRGLGKGLWGGVDAQEYVDSLRDGWEEPSK